MAIVIFICRYAESLPKQILGPACMQSNEKLDMKYSFSKLTHKQFFINKFSLPLKWQVHVDKTLIWKKQI